MSRKAATKKLLAAGCGVKVKKRETSGKKRGKVLSQKPLKGETLPPGTLSGSSSADSAQRS